MPGQGCLALALAAAAEDAADQCLMSQGTVVSLSAIQPAGGENVNKSVLG